MARLRFLGVVALMSLLAWALATRMGVFDDAPGPLGLYDKVTAFRLPVIGEPGRMLSLTDYRGQGVLLNFWAPGCEPCRDELPMLERLQTRYGGLNFGIIGVTDAKISRAREFLEGAALSFPTIHDPDRKLRARFGAEVVPYTVFVGPDGRVAGGHRGRLDEASAAQAVERLIVLSRAYQRRERSLRRRSHDE